MHNYYKEIYKLVDEAEVASKLHFDDGAIDSAEFHRRLMRVVNQLRAINTGYSKFAAGLYACALRVMIPKKART